MRMILKEPRPEKELMIDMDKVIQYTPGFQTIYVQWSPLYIKAEEDVQPR